jgi:Tol biopolymer transport system component
VILVGGLLVTPALGIGSRLLGLFESDPGPPGGRTPVWSPNGKRIAFLSRRKPGNWELFVMNADGSGQRLLMRGVAPRSTPAWSPDGRMIAFDDGAGAVYVANADGSWRRRLVSRDTIVSSNGGSAGGGAPAWSPDGQKIAFVSGSKVFVMNADGSAYRSLTQRLNMGRVPSLAWSPDGRKFVFLGGGGCGDFCFHLYVMNADGSGVQNLTPNLRGGPGHGAWDPAWSPDGGKIAFVRLDARGGVYVVKPDGTGVRNLMKAPAGYAMPSCPTSTCAPAWSPDGRKLAFATDRDGNSEVYVINADGSGRRNLTLDPAYDGDPMWSPDGRRIAFVSNRDGSYGVYVMNADGNGQRRLAQHSP